MNRPITIIGGGLAGLTLGIALRKRSVPVVICEASSYPRHRVCGEFISGRGLRVLERIGLLETVIDAGAVEARTAVFFAGTRSSGVRELPSPALCISRRTLDSLFADQFKSAGGELRTGERRQPGPGEGIVVASGRRARPTEKGWRWFGLKAHIRGLDLDADLEMHISQTGYVGINRVDDGRVNVCGLFRNRPGECAASDASELLRGINGSPLHEKLAKAEFDPGSLCSVAGLSLEPRRAAHDNLCVIGDAITMTPPVTGNGMSMAFESASIAVEPLSEFSRGKTSWESARREIATACDREFARRLKWARCVQQLMFSRFFHSIAGASLLKSEWLWRMMFARTR